MFFPTSTPTAAFQHSRHFRARFFPQNLPRGAVSDFCSSRNIQWKFIPKRSPHFSGIWESAVKRVKTHLKRIVPPVKLTFEEFSTVLTQIEACLNSRPLTSVNSPDDDGVTALTPGHFLIGKPPTLLPDSQLSYRSVSLLKRWHLCQHLVRHFWNVGTISTFTQQIQVALSYKKCRRW